MSLFDILGSARPSAAPSPALEAGIATVEPTPNLRAGTAAPSSASAAPSLSEAPTATNDSGTNGGGGNRTDAGGLYSLRYFDRIRTEATDVTRRKGSNVDVFTDPNTGETVALCHISVVLGFTHGDFVPSPGELEHSFSIALALQHLNTGNGTLVPEVAGLNERCPVRFTLELADDEFQGGVALRHVVAQTRRRLPARRPCAFIGAQRSSVTMPMSIVTGLFGYPQVSGASTSVDLDDKSQYPLFGRTLPSDVGNTVPLVIYMRQTLGLQHLAVINVNDAYGNAFVDGLRAAAERYAPGLAISQIPLDEGQGSIAAAVQSLKDTRFRFVFCIVFGRETHDALLTEAYRHGVAGDGLHNWLFADSFGGVLVDRQFEKGSPLGKAYQGAGLLEAAGGSPGLPGYDEYTLELIDLKKPTDLDYIGSLLPEHNHPNYPADYKDNPFLFQDTFLEPVTSGYAPFHYEAAIALGLSACEAFNNDTLLPLTGQNHYTMFRSTTFTGIADPVVFDTVTGTRLPTSTLYRVVNWIAEESGNGTLTFAPVVSDLFLHGKWKSQQAYLFNDGTTKLPVDIAPPDGTDDANLVLVVALPVAIALIAALVIFLFYENKRKQSDSVWMVDRKELKFSEPPVVIGYGTFGEVLLAEYRGTQVAVKHIIPSLKIDRLDSTGLSQTGHSLPTKFGNSDTSGGLNNGKFNLEQRSHGTSSWAGGPIVIPSVAEDSDTNGGPMSLASRIAKERDASARRKMKLDFMSEMRYLSKLRHPCITTIMGAVIDKGEPMMVMEYMDHGSLYSLLHNETLLLESDMLLNFLRDIAQGVRFLHSATPQVIHGDLKTANILVDGRFRAKVADFGLSKKGKRSGTGTPFWMAPELLRMETSNSPATDAYSFGMILYEVYSRRDPYEGEDSCSVLEAIKDKAVRKRPPVPKNMSAQVQSVMSDCLEDEPERRPTFEELDIRLKRLDAETIEMGIKPKSTVSLFDIFPRHIAEALRDGRPVEPEHREIVTVFFSDIVGFTDISGTLEPRKVADMLDRLYTRFDTLSHQHEIFKLETIGDAYVAVTNLVKDQPNDHARRIAEFAVDAITAANETLIDHDNPQRGHVSIRVGFHCGPVVADVVGTRNPRYCLFGDTVNTASRMESSSEVNRIHCSDAAARILHEQCPDLPLTSRGKISIKGKGIMRTWWVNEGAGQRHSFREDSERLLVNTSLTGSQKLVGPVDNLALKKSLLGDESSLEEALTSNSQENTDRAKTALAKLCEAVPESTTMDNSCAPPIDKPESPLDAESSTSPTAATGALIESSSTTVKEMSIAEFTAPPGKLGIVVDTRSGEPVIYRVHQSSAIREHVAVGDILYEIDGVDTRGMTHTAISALMTNSVQLERNIKVLRDV